MTHAEAMQALRDVIDLIEPDFEIGLRLNIDRPGKRGFAVVPADFLDHLLEIKEEYNMLGRTPEDDERESRELIALMLGYDHSKLQ